MTKDEALNMCFEYIETNAHGSKFIRFIKEALAQPEQEPVAWMNDSTPSGIFARHIDGARNFGCTIPLYTTPPQRTWVGLMRGVRVEGDTVVISVKGGNDAARELCGALIEEMNR